jgi:hypothetical protein
VKKKIALSLFALLLLFTTQAQQWWKPTKREFFGYGAFALSGVSYGFNQAIEHHSYGLGNDFTDISRSFKRKYKNFDAGDFREAYIGSKTFLAWTTDAFHLTNTIDKGFLTTGIVLNTWDIKSDLQKYNKRDRWKVIVFKKILLPLIIQDLSFELTFNNLHN